MNAPCNHAEAFCVIGNYWNCPRCKARSEAKMVSFSSIQAMYPGEKIKVAPVLKSDGTVAGLSVQRKGDLVVDEEGNLTLVTGEENLRAAILKRLEPEEDSWAGQAGCVSPWAEDPGIKAMRTLGQAIEGMKEHVLRSTVDMKKLGTELASLCEWFNEHTKIPVKPGYPVTNAHTVYISGAPVAGTNAAICTGPTAAEIAAAIWDEPLPHPGVSVPAPKYTYEGGSFGAGNLFLHTATYKNEPHPDRLDPVDLVVKPTPIADEDKRFADGLRREMQLRHLWIR